jgi:hypothetical protein
MALQLPELDDLRWSDMVTRIRGRIAALSDGAWTLHAPVDPGVTLLELFAWLLEQRLYWMDQVPDPLVRASLALLGAEAPAGAQTAATVLRLSYPDDDPRYFRSLPRLTELRRTGSVPSIIFSLSSGVTLLPVERVAIELAGVDRSADLEQGRAVRIFPADGKNAEISILLRLRHPLPDAAPKEPISLFFELRDSGGVPAQWRAGAAAAVPPPAAISWWYRSATSGERARFPQVADGTGGFRRSGVVRLALPVNPADGKPDWRPEEGGLAYRLWAGTDSATFAAPPRLERLIPNAAIARHLRRTQTHRLCESWLPLPGNRLDLSRLPAAEPEKDHPPLERSVALLVLERDRRWYRWRPVADLACKGPGDRVFLVDRERGELRFGDGLTGRLPVLAAPGPDKPSPDNLKLRYLVGGGAAGNIGEKLEWVGVASDQQTLAGMNLVPCEGGADPEPVESARKRAAAALARPERAVIGKDYEELACTTPGVAIKRAFVAVGHHPGHPCALVPGAVTLFVVPDVPREEEEPQWVESAFVAAPLPDPGALTAVRARLEQARLVASEVFVLGPSYRPVALEVAVEADLSEAQGRELRGAMQKGLQDFLDPLVGGDDRLGWPFGGALRPSALLREAQRALPPHAQATAVAIRLLDDKEPAEECQDVNIGPHDLPLLKEFKVRLKRSFAGAGGLR